MKSMLCLLLKRAILAAAVLMALVWVSQSRGAAGDSAQPVPAQGVIKGLGNPEVHELSANVYAVTGLYHPAGSDVGVSAGIIVTKKSVVFIDAGMTIASAEFLWRAAGERMNGKKNVYLILTHHHSDHVFGMRLFVDSGATVIAHESVRHFLENDNGRYKRFIISMDSLSAEEGDAIYGDVVLSLPGVLIDCDTVLHIDGEEIRVLATPGHVPSELSVFHPGSKTLFAGDAIYEGIPPHTRFGDVPQWRQWIDHLTGLKALNIAAIVPGHGRLCSPDEIDRNIEHLERTIAGAE